MANPIVRQQDDMTAFYTVDGVPIEIDPHYILASRIANDLASMRNRKQSSLQSMNREMAKMRGMLSCH